MKRGRKPQPSHILDSKGAFDKNPSRRRQEPIAPKGRPDPPRHIGQIARAKWRKICEDLEATGILSQVDAHAIEIAAVCYEQWRQLSTQLKKSGHDKPNGQRRSASVRCREALQEYRRMLTELGLTPSSRSSLDAKPTKGKSKIAQLLSRRQAS